MAALLEEFNENSGLNERALVVIAIVDGARFEIDGNVSECLKVLAGWLSFMGLWMK